MGNRLASSSPNEILPLEAYIKELNVDNSIESLGSTRFMKVARVANSSGCQVWKVFIIPDDTLDLSEYFAEFDRIAAALANGAPNCAPFRKLHRHAKHAVICRPFARLTLFDRFSTRPFTVPIERQWYIYQLIRALSQSHAAGVVHGDLKSQNVLVTAAGWVQIADFAFFKPAFLPEDNPSTYTYFFDTSRRQSCYVAPERILSQQDIAKLGGLDNRKTFDGLDPSMDIFSLACVILEILHDGHPPFTFAQLCRYRSMLESDANIFIDKLTAPTGPLAPVLRRMLSRDPKKRPSAEAILKEPSIFPEILPYLFNYLNIFRPKDTATSTCSQDEYLSQPANAMEADDVIVKLIHDQNTLLARLSADDAPDDAAVFFVSLITSNLRAIRSPSTRVNAMRLLVALCAHPKTSPSIGLQRVLPYLVSQLQVPRSDAQIGAFAVDAIAHLVVGTPDRPCIPETLEDSLIFIDYLFPKFEQLLTERAGPQTFILRALAKHLGRFAECAHRFSRVRKDLKARAANRDEDVVGTAEGTTVDGDEKSDRDTLSREMQSLFTNLTVNDEAKLCLAKPASLRRLFEFFTAFDCPEIILQQSITLMNAMNEWRLRAAFFDSLPIIVTMRLLRAYASSVSAFFQQGLQDAEEAVVAKTIACVRLMCVRQIMEEKDVMALVRDVLPFLLHPNDVLRGEAAEFVVAIDALLHLADFQCKLLPAVAPFLTENLLRLNSKTVLLASIARPIPREVWSKVMALDVPSTVKLVQALESPADAPALSSKHPAIKGVLEEAAWRGPLRAFSAHLRKMAEFRDRLPSDDPKSKSKDALAHINNGKVILTAGDTALLKEHSLSSQSRTGDSFAASMQNQMRVSVCDISLAELLEQKRREMQGRSSSSGGGGGAMTRNNRGAPVRSTIANLEGRHVSHLHEHSGKIVQLAASPDGARVASASSDGSLKLWPAAQLGGNSYGAVRSDATYAPERPDGLRTPVPLSGVGWTHAAERIVVADREGTLLWTDLSTSIREVSKLAVPYDEGGIEQLITSGHLVYARTFHGGFYCFDSRVGTTGSGGRHQVWKRRADNQRGVVTSFCVDTACDRWMSFSCTSKQIALWDLRLLVEVNAWKHPAPTGVPMKVWATEQAEMMRHGPEVFVGNSVCAELSLLNLSTGSRTNTFWPSHLRAPLDYTGAPTGAGRGEANRDYHRTVSSIALEEGGWVLVGDTRGELRKWNVLHPYASSYLAGIGQYFPSRPMAVRYVHKSMDPPQETASVVVTYEETPKVQRAQLETSGTWLRRATTCHLAGISALLTLPSGLALSAADDGSLKVWR